MARELAGELIVGLDVATRQDAERIVALLEGTADFFKIGYQLAYGGDGLGLGKALIAAGKRVFFDLKLLDIDNTVEKGAAAIAETGAQMLTVHAYPNAMRAAVRGARGSGLTVLGVTALTSMTDDDVLAAGYAATVADLVAVRLGQARDIGIGGVVVSGHEARRARDTLGPQAAVVTPGIRPLGGDAADQKRVMTPTKALEAGASHLVVARPIVEAPDPRAAALTILAEMDALAAQQGGAQ